MNSATTLAAFVAHCRKLARRHHSSDAELLYRLAQRRDAGAFEELLARHAPLVWGVCKRIVSCEADCEDAFQAAFLALFRQAGSVDPQRSLGAWLHGVAVHTARKAEASAARQRTNATIPERAAFGDVVDALGSRELCRIVDDEIERLPVAVREPLILCCLQGRTRDEAAQTLGCSVAAIKGRLERGREILRKRLQRRGVELPLAFLALGLTGNRVAASLRAKAMQTIFGSASTAVTALVPVAASSLVGKMTLTAMAFVMVGVIGFGALRVVEGEQSTEAPAQKADALPTLPRSPVSEKTQPRLDRFGDPLPEGAIRRFGTQRFRLRGYTELLFTPDGKQLVAGGRGGPLVVFDGVTGQKLRELSNEATESHQWRAFALSPDGKRVAGCGFQALYLWEFSTGRLLHKIFHCDECREVAFSSDGTKIAVIQEPRGRGREKQTKIIVLNAASETRSPKIVAEQTLKEGKQLEFGIGGLAFSPDGKYLAVCFSEMREEKPAIHKAVSSQVWLLDASTGTRVRTIGSADRFGIAFAFQPGSGRLATYGEDGTIRFWETATGKEMQHFQAAQAKEEEGYAKLRFSGDGSRCAVATTRGKYLSVLDTKDGRIIRRLKGEESELRHNLALSADGKSVASAQNWDASCIRVWDVASGSERLANAGHREAITTLSFTPDEHKLISRDESGRTIHWNRRTTQGEVQPFDPRTEIGRFVWRRDFSRKTLRGTRWQMVYQNQRSAIMEIKSLDGSRTIAKTEVPGPMLPTVALAPTGTHLAVVPYNQSTLWLWNPEREEKPRRFSLEAQTCSQLLFSHDGKRLIARTSLGRPNLPGILQAWDVETGKVVHKRRNTAPGGPLRLTADDRILFLGEGGKDAVVRVWDMETGTDRAALTLPSPKPSREENGTGIQSWIAALALAPDERFLAVVSATSEESTLSIWETASGKRIKIFPPTQPGNEVKALLFSRTNRSLFVSNSDSTILEWDVSGRFGQKTEKPNRDRLNILWRTLLETPDKAYAAVWELLDHPAEAVPFLIGKLAPIKPVEEKRVRQLLAQLDSESFAEREEASRQLVALGEPALAPLRQALQERPSLEMKKRLEGAIESLIRPPSPEQLRSLRALAVLEWSGVAEADEHLRRLADGAPSATLTNAAKAALQRRAQKSSARLPSPKVK